MMSRDFLTCHLAETQMEVNLDATSANLAHGDSFYYLDVVVVELDSHSVLSYSNKIQIGDGP